VGYGGCKGTRRLLFCSALLFVMGSLGIPGNQPARTYPLNLMNLEDRSMYSRCLPRTPAPRQQQLVRLGLSNSTNRETGAYQRPKVGAPNGWAPVWVGPLGSLKRELSVHDLRFSV